MPALRRGLPAELATTAKAASEQGNGMQKSESSD